MFGWIVLAFTAARFAAMGFNRIVDREYRRAQSAHADARAAARRADACARRRLSVAVASVALRLSRRGGSIRSALLLSPIALAWVLFYSYTKRFTRWSHLVLGLGHVDRAGGRLPRRHGAVERAVVDAAARSRSRWSRGSAGFDILYALQDVAFDRAQGLHSIPAALGERGASRCRAVLHAGTVRVARAGRAGAFSGDGRWMLYAAGVCVAAALLLYEHSLVKAGRPLEARRRVLHDERRHQHRCSSGSCSRSGSCRVSGAAALCAISDGAPLPIVDRDHRRVGRAVRGAAARSAARACDSRVQLIVSDHGLRLLRDGDRTSDRSPSLRARVGADARGTRTSPCSTTAIAARRPLRFGAQPRAWCICPCSMGTIAAIARARRARSSSARPTSR